MFKRRFQPDHGHPFLLRQSYFCRRKPTDLHQRTRRLQLRVPLENSFGLSGEQEAGVFRGSAFADQLRPAPRRSRRLKEARSRERQSPRLRQKRPPSQSVRHQRLSARSFFRGAEMSTWSRRLHAGYLASRTAQFR